MVPNYYDRGVCHVFPILFYDNEFVGASLSYSTHPRNSYRPSEIPHPTVIAVPRDTSFKKAHATQNDLLPLGKAFVTELKTKG
jgi:hypothetical protein